jgi:hypothetical protein
MNWRSSSFIALLVCSQVASANGSYIGSVKPMHYGSAIYLDVSATQMTARPSCAIRNYVRLQEAPTDPAYREKFAMILSAWLADRPIALYGTGSCTSEGDEIISIVGFP